MAVIEQWVIVLLLHLQSTFCPLYSLLSRVLTHRILNSTGSMQVGKFHLFHTHTLLGVCDEIDGIFEGRNHESTVESWPVRSDGREVEDVVTLCQLSGRGDGAGIEGNTSMASSLLVEHTAIHTCIFMKVYTTTVIY